jgi:hypothetical protein
MSYIIQLIDGTDIKDVYSISQFYDGQYYLEQDFSA